MQHPEDHVAVPMPLIVSGYSRLANRAIRGVTPTNDEAFQGDLLRLIELSSTRLAPAPSVPSSRGQRAIEQLRHGFIQQSLASVLRGLADTPCSLELMATLGRVLVELGGHETARRIFERVQAIDPTNATAQAGLDDAMDATAASDLLPGF